MHLFQAMNIYIFYSHLKIEQGMFKTQHLKIVYILKKCKYYYAHTGEIHLSVLFTDTLKDS